MVFFGLNKHSLYAMLLRFAAAMAVFANPSFAGASSYDSFNELKIGIVTSKSSPNQQSSFDAASRAYARLLGIDVRIIKFNSLGTMMDAHGSGRIHYGVHTTKSFVNLSSICKCLDALVRPKSQNGAIGFRSVLITRKDPSDNTNKMTIGFSRENSMSGGILPKMAMERGELSLPQLVELGSVANVVDAFLSNEIDGFFGWVPAYENQDTLSVTEIFGGFYEDLILSDDTHQIKWASAPLLYGPHAVHSSVPEKLKSELLELQVNLRTNQPDLYDIMEPYFSGGFVRSNLNEYFETARNLNQDITPKQHLDIDLELRPLITH